MLNGRSLPRMTLVVVAGAALLAPLLAPYDPASQLDIVGLQNSVPSLAHPLGTDAYSRDILSRVLFGARTSLLVSITATLVATVLGSVWGALAAGASVVASRAMMLTVDVVRSVPRMLLFLVAVTLAGALKPLWLALLLGVTAWPATSQLVYSMVQVTRSRTFVEAARATGAGPSRVFLHHILPHLAGPLTASGALLLADVLAVEAGLSFIGLGIRAPGASWGNMVQDALPYLGSAWWTVAIPSTCLIVTVLSVSAVADQFTKNPH